VIEALRRERARRAVAVLVELHAKRPAGPRGGARRGTSWFAPRRSRGRGADRVCLRACESRRRSRVA
jgi:hypothetical protein